MQGKMHNYNYFLLSIVINFVYKNVLTNSRENHFINNVTIHLVFQKLSNYTITWLQIWWIGKPKHVILCMLFVVKDNEPITEISAEKIDHCISLIWPDTVVHNPRAINTILQDILTGLKFVKYVPIYCWNNRLVSFKPFGGNDGPKNDFWWMQR